jgi:tetratricopeptide (TPR) repeat protein
VIGNELLKAGLRDLALVKFKEALLFQPDDADLQTKAELTPEERKNRAHVAPGVPPPPPPRADPAKDAATRVFLAAMNGRVSEARLALRTLSETDVGGVQSAKLADALRTIADKNTRKEEGYAPEKTRVIYELVSELDPLDQEARARAKPPAAAAPPSESPPAPTPAPTPGPTVPTTPPKAKRRENAETDGAPRDPAASQRFAAAGQAALLRGLLSDAEDAFNRAIRADSTNPIAVGGLAEVAFEHARYAEALDYARRASRLAPQSSKYLIVLGDAYFKLLRYDEAQATYQRARALAPKDDGIKSRLERVQAKLGGH